MTALYPYRAVPKVPATLRTHWYPACCPRVARASRYHVRNWQELADPCARHLPPQGRQAVIKGPGRKISIDTTPQRRQVRIKIGRDGRFRSGPATADQPSPGASDKYKYVPQCPPGPLRGNVRVLCPCLLGPRHRPQSCPCGAQRQPKLKSQSAGRDPDRGPCCPQSHLAGAPGIPAQKVWGTEFIGRGRRSRPQLLPAFQLAAS